MSKTDVLVIPGNTEIGLETGRSLQYSTYFNSVGLSTDLGHGQHIFNEYWNTPSVYSPDFLQEILNLVTSKPTFIIPAHDEATVLLADLPGFVGSPAATCEICRSKSKTYALFPEISPGPPPANEGFFIKPDRGQGSKGAQQVSAGFQIADGIVATEYLPGAEYTIDCFTDRHGELRFIGQRKRVRIGNGICLESERVDIPQLSDIAALINDRLKFRGAWFFQAKERADGTPVLMEIGARIAGSSGFWRANGVNLTLLSLYDAMDREVEILEHGTFSRSTRALETKWQTDYQCNIAYFDLDDCLIIDSKPNGPLLAILYKFLNAGYEVAILTRSTVFQSQVSMLDSGLSMLSQYVINVPKDAPKSEYMKTPAVFIDDSFAERKEVYNALKIPVFAPAEAIELWR